MFFLPPHNESRHMPSRSPGILYITAGHREHSSAVDPSDRTGVNTAISGSRLVPRLWGGGDRSVADLWYWVLVDPAQTQRASL